eukprot:NODE_382_length_2572_cov_41.207432_g362_i0.p1 GENE.NODE_382_length_2572_cov_41.207432_g362_i0~~NODE_382_length_2572_cov_41.207432_g362_i0.p1  ORF type:complete len:781 (+),score=206.16 NODE_382_length_2572_cov_41.207432_g362_i0:69-2345(+)
MMSFANRGKGKQAATPAKPSPQFEEEWDKMKGEFNVLLQFAESGYSRPPEWRSYVKSSMDAYTRVYNLCTKNEGMKAGTMNSSQILYDRTRVMIEDYLATRVTANVIGKKGDSLLESVHTYWDRHKSMVKWGKLMFRYLDDYYTKNNAIDSLRIMMLKCFSNAVYDKIKGDLCSVLLEEIHKERQQVVVSETVLQNAIGLYVEMGMDALDIYQRDFETHYVQRTTAYYREKASTWLSQPGGNVQYLKYVEDSLNDEASRCRRYMHTSSHKSIIGCVEEQLLTLRQTQVLEDPEAGTKALLGRWRCEDLARMFSLFKRISKGLEPMASHVREFIKDEGVAVNGRFGQGDLDGNAYIDACLDLHEKYSKLFKENFENNEIFHKARKEAFEVFINEQLANAKDANAKYTSSELLSSYCDNLMKNDKLVPDELEEKLELVVCLFSFISDKDLFQEFYRKQMSKRLLVSKTDNENERQLISKLKMKMGAPYTSKLEGMIQDKGVSAETQTKFADFAKQQGLQMSVDFSATILTTGYWPAFKVDNITLPEDLDYYIGIFQRFYDKTTNSRKLQWVHSLGTATVASKFPKGQKEIMLSTFQVCTMGIFNDRDSISVAEIVKALGMALDEVKRTIHSLAFGKFPVLRKVGAAKTKSIAETDEFEVNTDFACGQRKFKIPSVIKAVGGDTVQKNDENRRHVIEACVVRVMKSRRTLKHLELQTECIQLLSNVFKPDPKDIKKRIEDLIQRSYLERDPDDRNVYRYLA